jgi:hypothetical protein
VPAARATTRTAASTTAVSVAPGLCDFGLRLYCFTTYKPRYARRAVWCSR